MADDARQRDRRGATCRRDRPKRRAPIGRRIGREATKRAKAKQEHVQARVPVRYQHHITARRAPRSACRLSGSA